ncbi:MAG: tyrosine-type recombinase/integrase [Proteobacteria bacterium]|jgi:integrase|nr:tyrosine-type recombinase/integrase [Pseudomonadota bacterium]
MTVRHKRRRDPKTGEAQERLRIEIRFRHPNGRYQRIRLWAQGSTRREAEDEERKVIKSLEDGTFRKEEEVKEEEQKKMPTVAEFAQTFIEKYAVGLNKPSEVGTKRSIVRCYIDPFMGDRRLDEIGTVDIDAFRVSLIEDCGLSPKTTRNALAVVSKMFRYAVEIGAVERTPTVRFPKCPEPPFDYFQFDEAEQLLGTAREKSSLWYGPIFVAMKTGLRRGELFELRWRDVQLAGNQPHFRISRAVSRGIVGTPKNGKSRIVYLTPATVEFLEEHRRAKKKNSNAETSTLAVRREFGSQLVFACEDGSAISSNSSDWAIRHACELANLHEVGWHVLRHTCASHMAMRGIPLIAIKEQLGHSTIQQTMRYAHLAPGSVSESVSMLDGDDVKKTGTKWAREEAIAK